MVVRYVLKFVLDVIGLETKTLCRKVPYFQTKIPLSIADS